MKGLSERVITEMELLLHRKLSAKEVRLVLLASVIEERLLEDETTGVRRAPVSVAHEDTLKRTK